MISSTPLLNRSISLKIRIILWSEDLSQCPLAWLSFEVVCLPELQGSILHYTHTHTHTHSATSVIANSDQRSCHHHVQRPRCVNVLTPTCAPVGVFLLKWGVVRHTEAAFYYLKAAESDSTADQQKTLSNVNGTIYFLLFKRCNVQTHRFSNPQWHLQKLLLKSVFCHLKTD